MTRVDELSRRVSNLEADNPEDDSHDRRMWWFASSTLPQSDESRQRCLRFAEIDSPPPWETSATAS